MFREWLLRPLTQLITKGQQQIMSDLTALKTAFESYHNDVTTKITALGGKIDELQKAVDAGNDSAAVAELLSEVQAAHAELSGAAANPPAVPAPPAEGGDSSDTTPIPDNPDPNPGN